MAQIVPYQPREQVQARPNVGQVAPNVGFGAEIGDGLQAVARGVDEYGKAVEDFAVRQDNASVAELDTAFSDRVRKIQTDYLSTQGKNALSERPNADKAWDDALKEFSAAARNPRQATLFTQLARRRHDDWIGAAGLHQNKEVETYLDASESARAAAMGNDATVMPDGPERTARLEGQAAIIRQTGARKGLDTATVDAQILAARTVVHTNTIGAMIEAGGDPHEAESYLAKYADQIEPDKRTDLQEAVRTQVYKFDAMNAWDNEGPADPPVRHETPAAGGAPAQSFLLRPPVSAAMGSRYGPRTRPGPGASTNHGGVDYPVPVNTPVTASGPGVVRLRNQPGGMGQYVVVDHGNGLETLYGHVSSYQVEDGQRVEQGQVLALSGGARGANGAGNSTGPHLHYEVRRNGVRENPEADLGHTQQASAGSGQVDAAAMPRTAEDVRRIAARLAGDDWRKREVYEREGMQRLSQDRSEQSQREQDLARAAEDYLPGGRHAVSDISQMPAQYRNTASPAQYRSWNNAFLADQRGDSGVDPRTSDDLEANFRDLAMGTPDRQRQFIDMDLTAYRPMMTRSSFEGLRDLQRTLRADPQHGSKDRPSVASALSGTQPYRNQFYIAAGIRTDARATPEDNRRRAVADAEMERQTRLFIDRTGREPNPAEFQGMLSILNSTMVTTVDRDGDPGTAPEVRTVRRFEAPTGRLLIPDRDRRDVQRRLGLLGVRNPTDQQVQDFYNRGTFEGIYTPPRP